MTRNVLESRKRGGAPEQPTRYDESECLKLRAAALWAAQRRGLGDVDAEDVAQTTMIHLLLQEQVIESPGAWVHVVATRGAIDKMRRTRTRADLALSEFSEEEMGARYEGRGVASPELTMDVARSLARLPSETRRLWLERSLERRSMQELAEELGTSSSTLKRRLRRVKKALGVALREHAPRNFVATLGA